MVYEPLGPTCTAPREPLTTRALQVDTVTEMGLHPALTAVRGRVAAPRDAYEDSRLALRTTSSTGP